MLLHFSVLSTTTASSLVQNDHEAGGHAQAAMAVVSARRFRYRSGARLWFLSWFRRTVRPFLQKWGKEVKCSMEWKGIHTLWLEVCCLLLFRISIITELCCWFTLLFSRFSAYTRSGEAHAPCLSSEDSFAITIDCCTYPFGTAMIHWYIDLVFLYPKVPPTDDNVFCSSYTLSQSWIKCLPSHTVITRPVNRHLVAALGILLCDIITIF